MDTTQQIKQKLKRNPSTKTKSTASKTGQDKDSCYFYGVSPIGMTKYIKIYFSCLFLIDVIVKKNVIP